MVLAAGRVVAAGTAAQIIGQARTAVVRAADWAAALRRLERAGLRAVLAGPGLADAGLADTGLAGPGLRVPGRSAAEVAAALGDLPASVGTEPATLEERFFELVAGAIASIGMAADEPRTRTGPAAGRGEPDPRGHPRRGAAALRRAGVRRGDDPRHRRRRRGQPGAGASLLRDQGTAVRRRDAAARGAERDHHRRPRRGAGPARRGVRPAPRRDPGRHACCGSGTWPTSGRRSSGCSGPPRPPSRGWSCCASS